MPRLSGRLLFVTDGEQTRGRSLLDVLTVALRAGVPAVQLRERGLPTRDLLALARHVHQLTCTHNNQLLINDRVDIAMTMDGVGVHLRANSLPTVRVRKILGDDRLLGISTHSLEEVIQAESDGADYVVLGPVYETPSKVAFGPPLGLRILEEACQRVRIPIIGIGGVTAARVPEMRRAGVFGIAVVTAVSNASDVARATRELLDAFATEV
jgi:thiamine-phosphate pyrophosphorylase